MAQRRDSKGRFVTKGRSRRKSSRKRSRARRNARRMPRDAKGRFVSKGRKGRARRNAGRYSRTRRKSYRRNPVGGPIVGQLMDAGVSSVQIVLGKGLSRAVPDLVGLPQAGNVGVAIQAGTGVAIGYVADMAGFPELGARLLEGALVGAVEDLVVEYNVPFLAPALARTPGVVPAPGGGGTTGRYVPRHVPRAPSRGGLSPAATRGAMGRYVPAWPATN